jgi:hypothetical protein
MKTGERNRMRYFAVKNVSEFEPNPIQKARTISSVARLLSRSCRAGELLKTSNLKNLNLRQRVVRAMNSLCTRLSTARWASRIFFISYLSCLNGE